MPVLVFVLKSVITVNGKVLALLPVSELWTYIIAPDKRECWGFFKDNFSYFLTKTCIVTIR